MKMRRAAKFVILLTMLCSTQCVWAQESGVTITTQGTDRVVTAPGYTATVAKDGCLTSLKLGQDEYLAPGIDISRGLYIVQGGLVSLSAISQPSASEIDADAAKAALKYVFAKDTIAVTATNRASAACPVYIVFPPTLSNLADSAGNYVSAPTKQSWTNFSAILGHTKLNVSGIDSLWGPWVSGTQVAEMDLQPGQTRTLTLTAASQTATDQAKLLESHMPAPLPPLGILSPLDYEVFQRQSKLQGAIRLSGHVMGATLVQVRVMGKSLAGRLPGTWQNVPVNPAAHLFDAVLTTPAGGWYRVDLRAMRAGKPVAMLAVNHVGVGEVFVIAGQSNSTNYGETRTTETSGMVSSFSGSAWQLADDPQPGTHDNSTGGSPWPTFGDTLYARYHVPIAIASTGYGGTSVNQWQPDGDLFNFTITRIRELEPHGFRAVLWHQGESDIGMPSGDYAKKLAAVIRASQVEAGWVFPWFVAQVSYNSPAVPSVAGPRNGQKMLWDLGIALPGPDTDTLGGQNRQANGTGIHFSAQGLKAHGELWADTVGRYLGALLDRTSGRTH